jgi:hypothetical protein
VKLAVEVRYAKRLNAKGEFTAQLRKLFPMRSRKRLKEEGRIMNWNAEVSQKVELRRRNGANYEV